MQISVRAEVESVRRQLLYLQNEGVRRAAAVAINDSAFKTRAALQQEMRAVFDRPTPYALGAYFVRKARPQRLTAELGPRDREPGFLAPQTRGGARAPKRLEKHLRDRGILPAGMFAVPGQGARLDKYGNMSRGETQQILAQLRAYFDPLQRAPRGSKTTYYAATIRGTPGVWRRTRGGVVPVLVFVRAPHYRIRLRAQAVADATVARVFPAEFERQVLSQIRGIR